MLVRLKFSQEAELFDQAYLLSSDMRMCRNDVSGGRDAGCSAWLYGVDVKSFAEVVDRLRSGQIF